MSDPVGTETRRAGGGQIAHRPGVAIRDGW